MNQVTKSVVAPAAAKAAPKAAPRSAAKKTPFYAALLADALMGKFGNLLQGFYVNALSYHMKQKTVFPRARIAGVELLNQKDAVAFLEKHKGTSIPAGSKTGQRLFDEMMVQTKK